MGTLMQIGPPVSHLEVANGGSRATGEVGWLATQWRIHDVHLWGAFSYE